MKQVILLLLGYSMAHRNHENPSLNEGEIFEIMHDTFAKKDSTKSVREILAEEDSQEDQKPSD